MQVQCWTMNVASNLENSISGYSVDSLKLKTRSSVQLLSIQESTPQNATYKIHKGNYYK